jgi:predicted alpha/beta superfamily hydrolase
MLRPALLISILIVGCGGFPPPDVDAGGFVDAGAHLDAGLADAGLTPKDAGMTTVDAGAADAGPSMTVVRVHYPAGAKHLAIRGSVTPLDWNTGKPMTSGSDDTWSFTSSTVSGTLEFKPLLDDTTWSRGPNYVVQAGQSADVYPHFNITKGEVTKRWPSFSSTLLGNTRAVWVYLPPTYLENVRAKFPVIYMHDGQNLFDPSLAFGGNPWWAQNAVDAAAESGAFAEAIIIGPENTADRIAEYTPTADPQYGGGKGMLYLRMLAEELKPKVDGELRTIPDREHTVILGSSLGGLISSYAGTVKADTFGLVGAMSPSTWWDNKVLLTKVAMSPATPRPLRVYIDSGDSGTSNDDKDNTALLAQAYRTLGYSDGTTLKYVVQPGATHSEVYWSQRLPEALKFLVGPR